MLLDALGGAAGNLDFQKLLFLYCQEPDSGRPYDFVPYKFGACSFTSYADRRKLMACGFLAEDEYQWQLTEAGRHAIGRTLDLQLTAFARRYRHLRGAALVAETYRMAARNPGDRKAQAEAENRYNDAKALYDELKAFIDLVRQCAESGPPPARPQDTPREVDARFVMDLDDGVMINSAALWPLLEPQWKQPRTWWLELCKAKGKHDYDWSHLATRYFPKRVDVKCQHDPSLAVAHGCFWKYHPAKAYEWELRLQDEIGLDFTIDEAHADELRIRFTAEHPEKVKALTAAEHKRREKNRKKTSQASGRRRHNEGERAGEELG